MSAIIYHIRDYRRKEEKPDKTLEQLACELMDVVYHDRAIYETPKDSA